jgi:RNA polymerase sigma-70 factor (ECF subfamily)
MDAPRDLDAAERDAPGDVARQALEHLDALHHFAHHLSGSTSEAEDLVQETYARALGAQTSFSPGTNMRAWLFRILRNVYIDGRRRARLAPVAVDGEEQAADRAPYPQEPLRGDVEIEALRRVVAASIEQALAELSPDARTVVLLDLEGLTETEAAEVLGCPIGTVKSRLARARDALRQRLVEYRR